MWNKRNKWNKKNSLSALRSISAFRIIVQTRSICSTCSISLVERNKVSKGDIFFLFIAVLLPIISDCYKKSLNLHLCMQFMRPRNIAKVFSRCLILRMWQFFNSEGNNIDTPLGIDIVSCLFSDRTSYLSGVKYRSYILNWVRHNLQD